MNEQDLQARLTALATADGDAGFVALVAIAGLDPKRDFRAANLSGVNLRSQNLTSFDFRTARFDDADVTGAIFNDSVVSDQLRRARGVPAAVGGIALVAPRGLGNHGKALGKTLQFLNAIGSAVSTGLPVSIDFSDAIDMSPEASFLVTCAVEATLNNPSAAVITMSHGYVTGHSWMNRRGGSVRDANTYAFGSDGALELFSEDARSLCQWVQDKVRGQVEQDLYGILMELISNVRSHAGPYDQTFLKVGALLAGDVVHIGFVDHGVGIAGRLPQAMRKRRSDRWHIRQAISGKAIGERASGLGTVFNTVTYAEQFRSIQVLSGRGLFTWRRRPMGDREGHAAPVDGRFDGTAIFLTVGPLEVDIYDSRGDERTPPPTGWWRR